MIIWLTRELSMRGRIVVTAIIGGWMIMMMVLTIWYNQVIIREMRKEFTQLQADHKYMKSYMELGIKKFATTIQRNTETVKKTADVVKDIAEPDK
jgi:alanyl-tRNA synthetase